MSSRRPQVRMLFQSVPPRCLAGTTLEALTSRCESYLAAVDVWASKGNGRAVKQAGSGLVAICAWKAAKALAEDAQVEPFQQASGLAPLQFIASERDFGEAIQAAATASRHSRSLPTTPHRNSLRQPVDPAWAGASSSSPSQQQTPEALRKRARDVMSGAAFAKTSSSPLLVRSRVADVDVDDDSVGPETPTKRRLRDRSSIKETRIFDPSQEATTPTKRFPNPNRSGVEANESKRRTFETATAQEPPRKGGLPAKRRGIHVLVGYPAGEPLRMGRSEVMGKWDASGCRERVQQYVTALQRTREAVDWEPDQVVGQLRVEL